MWHFLPGDLHCAGGRKEGRKDSSYEALHPLVLIIAPPFLFLTTRLLLLLCSLTIRFAHFAIYIPFEAVLYENKVFFSAVTTTDVCISGSCKTVIESIQTRMNTPANKIELKFV